MQQGTERPVPSTALAFPRSIVEDDVWDAIVHMARNGRAQTSRFHKHVAVFGDFMHCEHSKVMWRQCAAERGGGNHPAVEAACGNLIFIHVPSRKHNAMLSTIVDFARMYGMRNADDAVTMPWILDENGDVVKGGYEGYARIARA